jgi:MoxR-like ATPase
MSQFSTPDEIFGPLSISKLKDEDKYERITARYLPGASVAFLDEIWKAGPSIQNALLTILNEKIYRNGEQEIRVPLRAIIAASNELPAKGQGLEALWDRFLLRIPVKGIENIETFKAMIAGPSQAPLSDPVSPKNKITNPEYQRWKAAINCIALPDSILDLIALIKTQYTGYVSDRRWRKIVHLLRTSAFFNDRKAVDLMDCFLISHCLWSDKEEIAKTAEFVRDMVEKYGYTGGFDGDGFREELKELQSEITGATRTIQDTRGTGPTLYSNTYYRFGYEYIKQQDFHQLKEESASVRLYSRQTLSAGYLYKQGGSGFGMEVNGRSMDLQTLFTLCREARIRKSEKTFSLIADDVEYELETSGIGDKRRITKKPEAGLVKAWDARIARLSEYLKERKNLLDQYRRQDAKHLRDNLFVPPENAGVIEAHIAAAGREIDKLEVEIREIQHRYHHLEDEDVRL